MSNFKFISLFENITATVANQKLSATYFGLHFGKNLLLLNYEFLTLMIILKENDANGLSTELVKIVSSRDKNMKNGVTIIGNKHTILMLDINGKLWKLINAFEFPKEKDEGFFMIEKNCFYEWVPFNGFRLSTILQFSSFDEGFACIGMDKNYQLKLHILSSLESSDLEDPSIDDLQLRNFAWYFMKNIKLNTSKSFFKNSLGNVYETLIVPDKVSGNVYMLSRDGRHCLVTCSTSFLLTVIHFKSDECLLLIFFCGKLLFIFYNESISYLGRKIFYLNRKLIFARQCKCCLNCFLWSDGFNLYHSEVKIKVNNSSNVNLEHLIINQSIKGIMNVLNVCKGLICMTVNDFYYYFAISELNKLKNCKKFSSELMLNVHESSLEVKKLNENLKLHKEFLKNKEIIQKTDLSKIVVEFEKKTPFIILKNLSQAILSKGIWRLLLLKSNENKMDVEITDVNSALNKDMSVNIQTDLNSNVKKDVVLIGNFESDIIIVMLKNHNKTYNRNVNIENEVRKFLCDKMKKKNLFENQQSVLTFQDLTYCN